MLLAALGLGAACRDRSATDPETPNSAAVLTGTGVPPVFVEEPSLLRVPTYDGSGQSVHPDVVLFDQPWHGARYWLTVTPYPSSDQRLENPSILTSDDGTSINAPAGLVNPVVKPPRKSNDYNSDPELLYDARHDQLVLFYRLVEHRTNTIHTATSHDGIVWTRGAAPFWVHNHRAVSPTVAPRPAAPARMWYVNAGKDGCDAVATRVMTRVATDTTGGIVDVQWSEAGVTDLAVPGYVVWHIKARWVPSKNEYWMLVSAFPRDGNGCKTDDLFFARSADGTHWTVYAEPLLRHGDRRWTAGAVYRSTFLYDAPSDQLSLWISARGADGAWGIGHAQLRYASLLHALETGTRITPPPAASFVATLQAGRTPQP